MNRVKINRELISKIKKEIEYHIFKIKRKAALPDDVFWSDDDNIAAIKHRLLESIEGASRICSHLNAKLFKRATESYADCFEKLCDGGIITDELAQRLIQMANFRNLLVHRYEIIDDKKVLKYARNNLDDFSDFLQSVSGYLATNPEI